MPVSGSWLKLEVPCMLHVMLHVWPLTRKLSFCSRRHSSQNWKLHQYRQPAPESPQQMSPRPFCCKLRDRWAEV